MDLDRNKLSNRINIYIYRLGTDNPQLQSADGISNLGRRSRAPPDPPIYVGGAPAPLTPPHILSRPPASPFIAGLMRYESIEISTISEIENASYSVGGERTGAEMWMGARGGVDGRVRGGRVGWVGVEKGRRGGGGCCGWSGDGGGGAVVGGGGGGVM